MKRRFSRIFLMIAGIATVIVILLSQSFYQPAGKNASASRKDHAKEKSNHRVSIAPDVVPCPAVQLDKNTPSLLKIVASEEGSAKSFLPDGKVFVSFFNAILRATISPNAP